MWNVQEFCDEWGEKGRVMVLGITIYSLLGILFRRLFPEPENDSHTLYRGLYREYRIEDLSLFSVLIRPGKSLSPPGSCLIQV